MSKLPISQGLRIPEPAKGKIFQWLAEGNNFRTAIAIINAVSNGKILVNVTMPDGSVETARGQLLISDVNSELNVPVDLSNLKTGGGASRIFAGPGAPTQPLLAAAAAAFGMTSPYSFLNGLNPDLYVNLSAQTIYYCTSAGTDSTSAWSQISTNLARFSLFSDNGFYWQCSTGTGIINVLKPYKLRTTLTSETILGIVHGYTYSVIGNASNNPSAPFNILQRLDASSSFGNVFQQMIPDPLPGDEIWASQCNVTVNGTAFSWIDVNVDGRNWTEIPSV